jgi:hypothetical protein
MAVSFTESVKGHLTVLRSDYSERVEFLLLYGWKPASRRDLRAGGESVLIARCPGTSG